MTRPEGCAASRRTALCTAAIASVGLGVAGCSTASHPAAGPATTATTTATVPTLGQPAGIFAHGEGFGQVKPSKIFNGGDPTGLVTHVAWKSWGGARAVATGISDYVGPNQSVAGGTEEAATVVAFNLGTCDGKLMYQAVEWYFPQHKQAFDPSRYEDICTGTYVSRSQEAARHQGPTSGPLLGQGSSRRRRCRNACSAVLAVRATAVS